MADTEWSRHNSIGGLNKSSVLYTGLSKDVQVPPLTIRELQRPFNEIIRVTNYTGKIKDEVKMFQEFKEREETILINLLRGGGKVAVMLPDGDAIKYMKTIQNEGGLVFPSWLKFTRIVHTIYFTGLTKWSLQIRVRIIEESGILQKWESLFHMNGLITATFENNVTAASMSGNIIIIFFVLICGLTLALFMILLEITFQSYAFFC